MNKRFYKNLRNIGIAWLIAGLSWTGYQVHKAEKEENKGLQHKYIMNAFYGFMGTFLGGKGTFILGQYKLNKLERELEDESSK